MKALAVIDKNLGLGRNNDLLFHLPSDLKHFKEATLGNTVIMGQKTLESMPKGKPLPGRNTLVLNNEAPTGLIAELEDGFVAYSFNNLDDFHEYIDKNAEKLGELILSGGATIYKLLVDECNELVLSEVDAEAENVDVYFPEFRDRFKLKRIEGPYRDGDLTYYIKTYLKKI